MPDLPPLVNSQDTGGTLTRCLGVNKDGSPCRARAQRDSCYCLAHDPRRVTDLTEWRRRGGEASSNRARARKQLPEGLLTNPELLGLIGKTIAELRAGAIEPGFARAVFDGARTYVTVSEAGAIETLQAHVDELRALISRRGSA